MEMTESQLETDVILHRMFVLQQAHILSVVMIEERGKDTVSQLLLVMDVGLVLIVHFCRMLIYQMDV